MQIIEALSRQLQEKLLPYKFNGNEKCFSLKISLSWYFLCIEYLMGVKSKIMNSISSSFVACVSLFINLMFPLPC